MVLQDDGLVREPEGAGNIFAFLGRQGATAETFVDRVCVVKAAVVVRSRCVEIASEEDNLPTCILRDHVQFLTK